MSHDPLFDLHDRVAVVTGGLGQLGVEYALALVKRGARVAVFDSGNPDAVESTEFQTHVESGTIPDPSGGHHQSRCHRGGTECGSR